jgi:AcrR family transcriptional regulator
MDTPEKQVVKKRTGRPPADREAIRRKSLDLWGRRALTMTELAKEVGCARSTLYAALGEDAAFSEEFEQLRDRQDALRVREVEEAFYATLIGKASKTIRFVHPAKIIFWLCNRAPERWRNVSTIKMQPDDAIDRILKAWEERQDNPERTDGRVDSGA